MSQAKDIQVLTQAFCPKKWLVADRSNHCCYVCTCFCCVHVCAGRVLCVCMCMHVCVMYVCVPLCGHVVCIVCVRACLCYMCVCVRACLYCVCIICIGVQVQDCVYNTVDVLIL